jgi:protein-S-isoprenylcysteine O-methyltransferase Ste14
MMGSLLALVGARIHLAAYRALNRQSTYQLTLSDDHRLVTSYPSSIARHPSYAGALLLIVGLGLTLGTHDDWIRSVVVPTIKSPTTLLRALALAWVGGGTLLFAFGLSFIGPRANTEDVMLKECEVWAERVPYEVIPCV